MDALNEVYKTLGGPWLTLVTPDIDADDDDAAEQRADDDRFERRHG